MGVVANVGFSEWPEQGGWVGRRTRVCFRYNTADTMLGTIVRNDHQEPFVGIIRLDDGRHVLMTECMHSPEPTNGARAALAKATGTTEDPR